MSCSEEDRSAAPPRERSKRENWLKRTLRSAAGADRPWRDHGDGGSLIRHLQSVACLVGTASITARMAAGACTVQKPRHAASSYSWTTPPRRSRRRTRASPDGEIVVASGRGSGGASDSARCGRCLL